MTSKFRKLSADDCLRVIWLDDDGCHEEEFEVDSKMTTARSITIEASTNAKAVRFTDALDAPSKLAVKYRHVLAGALILSIAPVDEDPLWDVLVTLLEHGIGTGDAFDVFVAKLSEMPLSWYADQRGMSIETLNQPVDGDLCDCRRRQRGSVAKDLPLDKQLLCLCRKRYSKS